MTHALVIAIDGPAGSGKSTVSRRVAEKLEFSYLDTGSVYRALGLWLAEQEVDPKQLVNGDAVLRDFANALSMNLSPQEPHILVAGEDYSTRIRQPQGSQAASSVAQNPQIRAFLVALFQEVIASNSVQGIVVEGRDITTVVATDARLRLLLTASEAVRMRRRGLEVEVGTELKQEISQRDAADSRMVDFFNAAPGVEVLDTSDLNLEEVISRVLEMWRGAGEEA